MVEIAAGILYTGIFKSLIEYGSDPAFGLKR
jgi:hypothetical protein